MTSLMSLTIALTSNNGFWISRLIQKFRGSFVKVMQVEMNGNNDETYYLFEIISAQNSDNICRELEKEQILRDVRLVKFGRDRIYGSGRAVCSSKCLLKKINCAFLRCITSGVNGEVYWHFVGSNADCRRIMQKLTDNGVLYRVVELSTLKGGNQITGKQELAVKVVLDLGYFDYLKRVNLKHLADLFDLSPATLSEEIRKRLKKILNQYFKNVDSIELLDGYREIEEKHTLLQLHQ
ncbi:MAG: helix-turn-helix domain-containing protein [Aigarchaeota archaeon]|nr:helix-turn-helix domain-containing protein [Candidatus Pelearchaeum maunauluense]